MSMSRGVYIEIDGQSGKHEETKRKIWIFSAFFIYIDGESEKHEETERKYGFFSAFFRSFWENFLIGNTRPWGAARADPPE